MKKLLSAMIAAAGISLITVPALAKGPHYGQGHRKNNQCTYNTQKRLKGSGGYRFGDGTQPRPQDGTGFGFKRGLQHNTQ